jgi:hypothetical protein
MATASFFEISTRAHSRFSTLPAYETAMEIVPLDENGGKRPGKDFLPRMHRIPKTPEGFALMAAVYPDANVGIRGRAEPGGIIVLDIDEPGTLERIEREYGPLPVTYTTLTRPISQPHKEHMYLMQTKFLLKHFRKQVTDVTHVAGYDLKCAGGWGYVVAEGSVRGGETISALYDRDVPIVPIPDSLVLWLVADIAKARAMKRPKAKPAPKPQPESESAEIEPASPRPAAVSRDDRNWTIKSRARSLKNLGLEDNDAIVNEITRQIRIGFEGGDLLLTPDYIRKIRATVRKTPTIGVRTSLRNLTRHRRQRRSTIPLPELRERFLSCPLDISPADARAFFSVKNRGDHQRLLREFLRHGYVYVGSQGSHSGIWSRPALPLALSPSTTYIPTIKKPSSSSQTTAYTHKAPQHKKLCMRTETPQDQEVAGARLIHTRMIEIPGKNGGDGGENQVYEATYA